MSIIAKLVRDTKDVARHAEHIVNEILIVIIILRRQLKIY